MSNETLQHNHNQIDDPIALRVMDEAIKLRKKQKKAGSKVDWHQVAVVPSWGQILGTDLKAERKATQKARDHYELHKDIYQDYAVRDAADEGVETNFEDKETIKRSFQSTKEEIDNLPESSSSTHQAL